MVQVATIDQGLQVTSSKLQLVHVTLLMLPHNSKSDAREAKDRASNCGASSLGLDSLNL